MEPTTISGFSKLIILPWARAEAARVGKSHTGHSPKNACSGLHFPVSKSQPPAGIPSRWRRVVTARTVRPRRWATALSGRFPSSASSSAVQWRQGDWRPSWILLWRRQEIPRPSLRANSLSEAVPSSASSAGCQGLSRTYSRPGRKIPSRRRRRFTASRLMPSNIATCASGRSLSTLSSAGVHRCILELKTGMRPVRRRAATLWALRFSRRASRRSDIVPSSSSSARLQRRP